MALLVGICYGDGWVCILSSPALVWRSGDSLSRRSVVATRSGAAGPRGCGWSSSFCARRLKSRAVTLGLGALAVLWATATGIVRCGLAFTGSFMLVAFVGPLAGKRVSARIRAVFIVSGNCRGPVDAQRFSLGHIFPLRGRAAAAKTFKAVSTSGGWRISATRPRSGIMPGIVSNFGSSVSTGAVGVRRRAGALLLLFQEDHQTSSRAKWSPL